MHLTTLCLCSLIAAIHWQPGAAPADAPAAALPAVDAPFDVLPPADATPPVSPVAEAPVTVAPAVDVGSVAPGAGPTTTGVKLDPLFLVPIGEAPAVEAPAVEATVAGNHWVLIICGHPGDEEHRSAFAETIESLYEGLTVNCGFAPERIAIQFGAEPEADDGPAVAASRGEATGEEIQAHVAELATQIGEHDTLWTIVMGHAHYDGRHTFLNLPGPDVHQDDFASWFAPIRGRQVFLISTPVSGYYVRPLSGEKRIVITATQADLEVNETLYPLALAEVLAEPPPMEQFDCDGDGKATLFDLYIAVTRNVAQRYLSDGLLATEHAALDDNGDGRGTELQLDYLTAAEGGRASEETTPPTIRPNSDGAGAIAFDFSMIRLPPPAEAEEAPTETTEEPADPEPADPEPADPK